MDVNELRAEVRDFLTTRRGRITPAEAGLPVYGGLRRVSGLRREELAMLAGLSVAYYRPGVQRILDALTAPALVSNARMDYLAANRSGRALYAPLFDSPVGTNAARFLLLDPRGPDFYPDWDQAVDDDVALMRTEAGRSPFDKVLTDLIGELSTRSDTFRERWARHDVRLHLTGTKRLRHLVVGDLDLRFETMELPADPGLALLLYTAEPGSESEQALTFLASWATGGTPAEQTQPTPRT